MQCLYKHWIWKNSKVPDTLDLQNEVSVFWQRSATISRKAAFRKVSLDRDRQALDAWHQEAYTTCRKARFHQNRVARATGTLSFRATHSCLPSTWLKKQDRKSQRRGPRSIPPGHCAACVRRQRPVPDVSPWWSTVIFQVPFLGRCSLPCSNMFLYKQQIVLPLSFSFGRNSDGMLLLSLQPHFPLCTLTPTASAPLQVSHLPATALPLQSAEQCPRAAMPYLQALAMRG